VSRCFVIQPFDKGKYDKRYYEHLKPAIEKAGLEAYRVDEDPSVTVPIETIEKEISRSAICLADITEDNPNVWYELGYAIASECPTVLICHVQRETQFPFDIRHRKIIEYSTESKKDFEKLEHEICQAIKAKSLEKKRISRGSDGIHSGSSFDLGERDIMFLSTLADEVNFPSDTVSVYSLKERYRELGFSGAAFNISFSVLLNKSFIETLEEQGYGDPYQVVKVSTEGWKWITSNEKVFELHARNIPPKSTAPPPIGSDLDDDIPF